MAKKNEPSIRELFVERMKREGREAEWHEKVKSKQTETGKGFSAASWVVMREMGYTLPEVERALHAEYEKNLHLTSAQKEMKENLQEIREEIRVQTFEEAMAKLPANASVQVELKWIAAHPAMTRLDRANDKTKSILIDWNDILHAPHGAAPSRAAANMLQHWVNRPGEFHKQMLSEQKKAEDAAGNSAQHAESDEDLAEVRHLLSQVRRGKEKPSDLATNEQARPSSDVQGEGGRRSESTASSEPTGNASAIDGGLA